ncbi:RANBP2-like and GRIP domain-containing protein 2 [Striga asiatica]|uniref:RANBP2-like and GRIP domain-containing protein 2 n=1 Tax=Striga asiatica TaxID=4170 RepID=A0A5A7QP93_STRAF|nr:RANBP2-like and GRIP domain-containing protein 2 [Striga asiatica]
MLNICVHELQNVTDYCEDLTLYILLKQKQMEVFGKSMVAGPTNVIYLSSILGQDGPKPIHKCDWKCQNEHVCGNMYRCRLTGLTHVCDKNCNQRILYDNHSSLCRVSKQIFPLTLVEQQAVKGVRRKLDSEGGPTESCGFKRRRDTQLHRPSPFERSFNAVGPICSPVGDVMDTN